MKINKIDHSYDLNCLDIWLRNFNILHNTILNNNKSLFNRLLKYKGLKYIHYMSNYENYMTNYKIRNGIVDIDDISEYKNELFNKNNIYNNTIHRISFYF